MFDQLFTSPRAVERYASGPLLDERLRYLAHCAAQGSTRSSLRLIAQHQLVAIEYLHLPTAEFPHGRADPCGCRCLGRPSTTTVHAQRDGLPTRAGPVHLGRQAVAQLPWASAHGRSPAPRLYAPGRGVCGLYGSGQGVVAMHGPQSVLARGTVSRPPLGATSVLRRGDHRRHRRRDCVQRPSGWVREDLDSESRERTPSVCPLRRAAGLVQIGPGSSHDVAAPVRR